jgi:2-oxoglutarate ferredoxin oxidoreductase subunit beta
MAEVILKSNEWGSKIPLGVFYQNDRVPTYQERISSKIHNYAASPPSRQVIESFDHKAVADIRKLLDTLKVDN